MFAQSSDLKVLDKRYHDKAQQSKTTTTSLDDWAPQDIERWDLDEPHRKPTGREYARTWRYEKPLLETNRATSRPNRVRDARTNPRIRDADEDPLS